MTAGVFPPSPLKLGTSETFGAVFKQNVQANPILLYSLIIFIIAIIHTLLAHQITHYAHTLAKRRAEKNPDKKEVYSFGIEVLHFIGEVEVIFALWVIPLLLVITHFYDWKTAVGYLSQVQFTEPIFVVVIMIVASTKPILKTAEWCLSQLAKVFKGSTTAWWFIILSICPILGSFITEPGAMTLGALLLKKQFYEKKPSKTLAYATLGLLFVNISIGGVLTNFAAPPVLMVAKKWGWTNSFMFNHFGLKSVISILVANVVYFFVFRKHFKDLKSDENTQTEEVVPVWITLIHIFYLVAVVFFSHYPVILVGIIFLFIAFQKATAPHQDQLALRGPILVGTFLSGLVIHGSLQGWWIEPIIKGFKPAPLMFVAAALTSFNDNALITYLTSLIEGLSPTMKYAVMCGAVGGGGLTVIANAPNPAGQFLLADHFEDGVAPLNLFLAALFPTAIFLAISLYLLRYH